MSQPVFIHILQELTVPLFALLAWAMVALFLCSLGRTIHAGICRLQSLHQVPCDRCAFFTGDYRLKCTVHPITALSEAAIDCRDFEPAIPAWQSSQYSCPALKPEVAIVSASLDTPISTTLS
jgi:hypothetical protein